MDFSKLLLAKRQTKLSDKAHAFQDQGTTGQVRAKRKNINEDAPAAPKKGKLTQDNGIGHMSSQISDIGCPPATRSTWSEVTLTASRALVGDDVSPTAPSDSDTALPTSQAGVSQVGHAIITVDSDENENENENDETADEELGTMLFI